jgi:hypothetical protein
MFVSFDNRLLDWIKIKRLSAYREESSAYANDGRNSQAAGSDFGICGVQPTVYGSQPFISGKEAVVRDPAVYRCKSVSFLSFSYLKIINQNFLSWLDLPVVIRSTTLRGGLDIQWVCGS